MSNWLTLGALLALLAGFGWYTHHERELGRAEVQAKDAKLAAADRQHNADVKALADAKSAKAGETYIATTQLPATHVPSVVCQRPRPAHVLPATAADSGVPADSAHGGETVTLDIGPALDAGRNADALITALQTEVIILRDAMQGKAQ